MTPIRAVIAIGACVLGAVAIGSALDARSEFEVVDSRMRVSRAPGSFYWLDDRRVLFLGSTEDGLPALTQWEPGGGSTVVRARVRHFCTRPPDFVMFREQVGATSKESAYYAGPLGAEQPIDGARVRFWDCTEQDPPDKKAPRRISRLRPGHGYLDYGPKDGPEALINPPADYYPREGAPPIRLPFAHNEAHAPRYFDWRGAYYIGLSYVAPGTSHGQGWPKGQMATAYWLYPGGKLEKVTLPGDIAVFPIPTRAGMVYRELERPRGYAVKLHTLDGRRVTIAKTNASEVVVSPSGCRIAFNGGPADYTRKTVQVAELCKP